LDLIHHLFVALLSDDGRRGPCLLPRRHDLVSWWRHGIDDDRYMTHFVPIASYFIIFLLSVSILSLLSLMWIIVVTKQVGRRLMHHSMMRRTGITPTMIMIMTIIIVVVVITTTSIDSPGNVMHRAHVARGALRWGSVYRRIPLWR